MLILTTLLFLFFDLAVSMVIDANFFMSLLSNPPNPAIIPLDLAISKHPITTIITLLDLAIDSNSKDPTVLLGLPLIILLITDLNSSRFFPFLPPHSHTHCFNPQVFLLLFFLLLLFIYCTCLHFYAYYSIMILFIFMIRFFVTHNNTCCFIVFVLQPFENKWSRGASVPSSRQRPDSQPANHK